MNKYTKRLYYKFYDYLQYSTFLGKNDLSREILETIKIIDKNNAYNFLILSERELSLLGLKSKFIHYLFEFKETNKINDIDNLGNNIDEWIKDLVIPGCFDNEILRRVFVTQGINNREDLMSYIKSKEFRAKYGQDIYRQYVHYLKALDWSQYPNQFAKHYHFSEDFLLNDINGTLLGGNFHNHTIYSDGSLEICELIELAKTSHKQFIGISDHTSAMNGVSAETLENQISEITKFQRECPVKIFKSVECEVLPNGDLDLPSQSLDLLDYVIIGIHTNADLSRPEMELRMIKAIENPYSNILAHPSGRIYKKKPAVNVDMYKIIDACVANNVVIEINGDPTRLDLDPKYISYALKKGAYFSLDSDTHKKDGFLNINNAILIAINNHIPPERCINTFSIPDLYDFFELSPS